MLNRRSLAVLAASVLAVSALVTAASAHIIWEPFEPDIPTTNPRYNYTVYATAVSYPRTIPVTVVSKPANITVSGPASIVLPANATQATALYTFTGAQNNQQVTMKNWVGENEWTHILWFYTP